MHAENKERCTSILHIIISKPFHINQKQNLHFNLYLDSLIINKFMENKMNKQGLKYIDLVKLA